MTMIETRPTIDPERVRSTYRASRKNGAPADGALRYARMEALLALAEDHGRIRFRWEDDIDYEPEAAGDDADSQWWLALERRQLERGDTVAVGCIAELPPPDPFGIVYEGDTVCCWKEAASLWGVVVWSGEAWRHVNGSDHPSYDMRMVEVDLAFEAGVL